ncbi:hypothetical protein TrLO_g14979 [Triparma laevis f. longispina]|uniref:Uncharacterized protein n=1 Tax=Triparma laevis f. longispina TaxID=1714387 RepID=A0A9W7EHM6_9STRA|nr:hypothetical protein TrLO_g14979 [Triparma laevis f. longispina]
MGGGGDSLVSVDQTSAIIGVLTVTLVIFVETLRHQLDRSVQGHAFATNVVEHCYRELTTLGIVEFGIFIIHKTAPWADGRDGSFKLSLEVEEKFAQAHITLFLTAVLYAFHMCLIAFISFHLSGRWNEIEKMELDHYIEVRHAFERIKEDLKITARDFDDMATLKDKTALYLWSPIKARRYDRLLEQIRFHELRAYFLAANNLPKDFQLSVYLNQCQCNVLIHLVELSTSTWMFLLIILTLFFYFATMEVSLNTASEPVPNLPITGFLTFEGGCCFVLALGILLKFKMDSIYKTMMYDPEMMQPKHVTGEQPPQNTRFQIDLFWKRNPYLIITFYQYMSFMYAVGASVLLLYGADFSGNVLFITILTFLLSYLLNLGLVSYFMPRFTLCVSVGQLTDRATLNEALSDHRLKKLKEKAKKKRVHPHHASKSSSMTLREKTVHFIDKHIRKSSNESGQSEARTAEHINFLSNRFAVSKAEPRPAPKPPTPTDPPPPPHPLRIDASSRASFRTSKLPATPQQYYSPHYANKRAHLADHHSKASIHWLDIANFATKPTSELPSSQEKKKQGERPRRKKSISDTAKILMMSGVPKDEAEVVSNPGPSPPKSNPSLRKRPQRSLSDGVMAMCSPSANEDLGSSKSPTRSRSPLPRSRSPKNMRSPKPHRRLQSVVEGEGMAEQSSPMVMAISRAPPQKKTPPPPLALNSSLDESSLDSVDLDERVEHLNDHLNPQSPYSAIDMSYDSITVHLSTLLEKFAASVTRFFNAHWAYISTLITISTVFTLAMRANYLLQFGSYYEFAIMFDESNKYALLGTSFWFPFSFLLILILEGLCQLLFHKRYILSCVDLPITIGCFICLVLSQTASDMEGSFGTKTPFSFNVLNYVQIILIFRLKREDFVYILERRYQIWNMNRRDVQKNIAKSLLAQEKFETSRRMSSIDHPQALIKSQHKVGTIVELWYAAMKDHPDIVHEQGAFSGELLMAMLEIPEDPISQRNIDVSGETAVDSEEEEGDVTRRNSVHKSKLSIESFGSLELPPPSTSTTIFENASRRMPPLLVDWEDINIAVDRERNDIRYFSIVDNKFLGRIAFEDITKITICGMIREKGLRGLTSPVTSPASTSALSPANAKSIQVMILLQMGSIVYIRFNSNETTTAFAALCGDLTGLSYVDSIADKVAAHRRRISVKW